MEVLLNMVGKWLCLEIVTLGILTENYLVILYQNEESAWNISVEWEQDFKGAHSGLR